MASDREQHKQKSEKTNLNNEQMNAELFQTFSKLQASKKLFEKLQMILELERER